MMTKSIRTPAAGAELDPSFAAARAGGSLGALRSTRLVRGAVAAFLLFDGGARLVGFGPYRAGTLEAGYPASYGVGIGLALIVSTLLLLLPRTRVLGAILLTGYLGGAVATNLRLGTPLLFPLLCGVLIWGSLALSDRGVRALIGL